MLRCVLSRRGKEAGAVGGAGELAAVDLLQGKVSKKIQKDVRDVGKMDGATGDAKGVGFNRKYHERGDGCLNSGEEFLRPGGVNGEGEWGNRRRGSQGIYRAREGRGQGRLLPEIREDSFPFLPAESPARGGRRGDVTACVTCR